MRILVPRFHQGLALVLLLLFAAAPVQAQYATFADVDVAWTLDPRDFPDLFDHPDSDNDGDISFGGEGLLVGMDHDGDGLKEILFTTDETLAPGTPDPGLLDVYLYENNGDDSYEHVWHWTHPEGSNSLPALEYGDIDGDGLFEIYMGIPTINDGNDLFVFEQGEDGTFPDEPTVTYGYERDPADDFRPSYFVLDDVDSDGQIELITTSRTGSNREVVVISPVGGLDGFTTWTIELEAGEDLLGGGAIYDAEVVDFDGDGQKEIWVNTWDLLSMTIWEATGPDTYELQVDINQVTPDVDHGSFDAISYTDIDGDGSLEMIWPSTQGGLIFLDDTDDVSTLTGDDFTIFAQFTSGQSRGADVGDFDGDFLTDIIIGTSFDEELIWAEYDGSGDPADSLSYTWTTIVLPNGTVDDGRFYPLRIADDLDGDGFNEIVVMNLYASFPGQSLMTVFEAGAATVSTEDGELPGAYALDQNYPNPFNPQTTIRFDVPQASAVTVQAFDVTGRLVRTLVDGTVAAGSHEVTFDATNLPSGVYLVRMDTPAGVFTRKALLVK